jgi:hypothetical protein
MIPLKKRPRFAAEQREKASYHSPLGWSPASFRGETVRKSLLTSFSLACHREGGNSQAHSENHALARGKNASGVGSLELARKCLLWWCRGPGLHITAEA